MKCRIPSIYFIYISLCLLFTCAFSWSDSLFSKNAKPILDHTLKEQVVGDNIGSHFCDVNVVERRVMSDGAEKEQTISTYRELASAMCYKDDKGRWCRSVAKPEWTSAGTILFSRMPVHYEFAPFADAREVLTSKRNGMVSGSAVAGLCYYDTTTRRSVVIALVRHAPVSLYEGAVVYEDAFEGVDADIVYWVEPACLQQDIQIFGELPNPVLLGLDPEHTVLCVLTELFDVPGDTENVRRPSRVRNNHPHPSSITIDGVVDGKRARLHHYAKSFSFVEADGVVSLGALPETSSGDGQVRGRERLVNLRIFEVGKRLFLSEEVPVSVIRNEVPEVLDEGVEIRRPVAYSIPPPRESKAICRVLRGQHNEEMAVNESHQPLFQNHVEQGAALKLACYRPRSERRYVIDYVEYSGTVTSNITFESGETYYISGNLFLENMTLTIEPGSYIKLAKGQEIHIDNGVVMNALCNARDPALFTSAFDTNNAAAVIPSCVGDPVTNMYSKLFRVGGGNVTNTMQGFVIKYARNAFKLLGDNGPYDFRDIELHNSLKLMRIMAGPSTVTVHNCLVAGADSAIKAEVNDLVISGCTFDQCEEVLDDAGVQHVAIYNTLFLCPTSVLSAGASVADYHHNALYHYDSAKTNQSIGSNSWTTLVNPQRSGTLGDYYLCSTSVMINAGTTNAGVLGMYHHTTDTGHLLESNSLIDIGFHYLPETDSDGDGLDNLTEDPNGNGIYESGTELTSWTNPDTDSDGINDGAEIDRGTEPDNPASCNITLYVSSNGSNSWDGLTSVYTNGHGPKRNMSSAVSDSFSGDTIRILTGAYDELTLSPSDRTLYFSPEQNVTIH